MVPRDFRAGFVALNYRSAPGLFPRWPCAAQLPSFDSDSVAPEGSRVEVVAVDCRFAPGLDVTLDEIEIEINIYFPASSPPLRRTYT